MEVKYRKDGIEFIDLQGNKTFLNIDDIINECNKIKIKDNALVLLQLEWESHRGFDGCYENIVMTKKNAQKFIETFTGVEVYFGEIAGKHSEIYGTLDEEDIELITDLDSVNQFLTEYPSGRDFNHSFTNRIGDKLYDGEYEGIDMAYDEYLELFRIEEK